MRNIKHPADAALWMVLLIGLIVCTCIFVATVANQLAYLASVSDGIHLSPIAKKSPTFKIITLESLPFLLMGAAILLTERHLTRGRIPARIYITLLCTTFLAFLWAFMWFQHPMHDIALHFGSHGRWGCGVSRLDGATPPIIRDVTVPWMLFAPMILAFTTHWIWSRKHEDTEQGGPGYPPQGVGSPDP